MTATSVSLGVFRLGERLIAVELDYLREVCSTPELHPMMSKFNGLCGGFILRDALLPMIDIADRFGYDDVGRTPLAVVLRNAGQAVAIAIDTVVGFDTIERSALQALSGEEMTDRTFTRAFVRKGQLVFVLDVEEFFRTPGLPLAENLQERKKDVAARDHATLLFFRAGGAEFAVDAKCVISTVPRQDLVARDIATGLFLGQIVYHNWKVPVIDICRYAGLGRTGEVNASEVVVLRGEDDSRIGLAVEFINRIAAVPRGRISREAGVIASGNRMAGVFVEGAMQIHILDPERFFADSEIASLCRISFDAAETDVAENAFSPRSAGQSQRYLVFEAGGTVSTPALDVISILRAPETILENPSGPEAWRGLFVHNGRSLPIVDLCQSGAMAKYVILAGEKERQVGFLVEDVVGLMELVWKEPGKRDTPVELAGSGGRFVCEHIDLMAEVDRLCA